MPEIWQAPWTEEQIELLDSWQESNLVHSYTCPNCIHDEHGGSLDLIPIAAGWFCPRCDYTQDWAYALDKPVPKHWDGAYG